MFEFLAPYMSIIKLSVIGLIITIIIGTVAYIKYQSGKINQLKLDNSKLSTAVVDQAKTIDKLTQNYKEILDLKDQYIKETKDLQLQITSLNDTLYRERKGRKSLEELLAADKRDRVLKLINDATKEVFRCFEILSGSPRTPADSNLVCKGKK